MDRMNVLSFTLTYANANTGYTVASGTNNILRAKIVSSVFATNVSLCLRIRVSLCARETEYLERSLPVYCTYKYKKLLYFGLERGTCDVDRFRLILSNLFAELRCFPMNIAVREISFILYEDLAV